MCVRMCSVCVCEVCSVCVCVRVCSVCEVGGITASFHSPTVARLTGAVYVRVCSVCV